MNAKEQAQSRLSTLTYMKNRCIAENRQPTAEERQILAEVAAELDEIGQSALIPEWFNQSQGRQTVPGGGPIGDGPGSYRPTTTTTSGPALDRTFRGMFPGTPLDRGGFKNQDDFLDVLNSGRYDPRLIRAGFTEGTPSEGGFSVPVEFSSQWLDLSLVQEVVRPLAQVWPMQSATRLVPGWDLLDMTGGVSFGGFEMQWLGEEGTGTVQQGKLRQIQLSAKKGAIYTQASNELVADGLGFAAQLQMALTGSIAYGFDRAFLRGTGAGMPLGVLSSGSLITVSKEPGQGADTLFYENIVNMWSRMYDVGKTRAVWIANPSIVGQLFTMGLVLGVGSAPVYLPAGGAAGSPNDTLFGRPLLFSPVMSALGDLFDIALVDLTQYAIGLRKEMAIDRSQAPGWTQDLDSWRIITRVDGMPTWNDVFTPEHGATQSWAVTLEAR
jgi:HK97 family phage major capsid protein